MCQSVEMTTEGRALKGAGKAAQKPVKVDGGVVLRQAQVQEAVAFMAHPRVRKYLAIEKVHCRSWSNTY